MTFQPMDKVVEREELASQLPNYYSECLKYAYHCDPSYYPLIAWEY